MRYEKDYRAAGVPVLPASRGSHRTTVQIVLYTLAYVGLALMSPWFVDSHYLYMFVVVPFAIKVIWELFRYWQDTEHKRWLPFFMWINFSMLVFLLAPVIDKWHTVVSNLP
jgi:protoheme IX farnesyltransferase